MTDPEIVIVGAGAAGIGAGLALAARGVPFVILEAMNRVGGRAWTDRTSLPYAWDRGCHWLHNAKVNPLVPVAEAAGANIDRGFTWQNRGVWKDGAWLDKAGQRRAQDAIDNAFRAINRAGARGLDVPISEILPDAGDWVPLVTHLLQLVESADPTDISAQGAADNDDSVHNWPVRSGYGAVIAGMAKNLPVRLSTPVTKIEQRAKGVRLTTAKGTLDAKAAIVTASTNVLTSGAIAFSNGPAKDLLDHVAEVPCGAYEKIAIAFDHSPFVDFGLENATIMDPAGGVPMFLQLAHFGAPLAVGELGGSHARAFSAAGEAATLDFALEKLTQAFGADVRKHVIAATMTQWSADPFVRGAYSYVKPGARQHRHDMIAADTGTLAFAGEAFSATGQATAHGAYLSGRDVAAKMAERLGV
jgi:monoamine oxidase